MNFDAAPAKKKSAKAKKPAEATVIPASAPKAAKAASLLSVNDELKALLMETVRSQSDETGWAYLTNVGNNLRLKNRTLIRATMVLTKRRNYSNHWAIYLK